MAYDNGSQRDIVLATANSILNSAASLYWSPGYQNFVLRAAAVVVTTATTVAASTLTLKKRPTAGSASGATTIDTIVVPTSTAAGAVIYIDGLNTELSPGQELEVAGDGGATAGAGTVVIYGETKWAAPGDNTAMTVSA